MGNDVEGAVQNAMDVDPLFNDIGGNTLGNDSDIVDRPGEVERYQATNRLRNERGDEFRAASSEEREAMIDRMIAQMRQEKADAEMAARCEKVENEVAAQMAVQDRYADAIGGPRMSGDERALWEDYYRRKAQEKFGVPSDISATSGGG